MNGCRPDLALDTLHVHLPLHRLFGWRLPRHHRGGERCGDPGPASSRRNNDNCNSDSDSDSNSSTDPLLPSEFACLTFVVAGWIDISNIVFTVIFTFEIICELAVYSPKDYLTEVVSYIHG